MAICMHRFTLRFSLSILGAVFAGVLPLESRADVPAPLDLSPEERSMPIADAHLHYKWNQAEVTSPQQAAAALRANNVQLAVVTGTPPSRALELYAAAPEIVVPIFGAYRKGGDWFGWQGRESLVAEAREALENGPYRGIGELHLIGGFAMRWNRSDVLRGLLALTAEHDVPMLIHTEFSRAEPTLSICKANPKNRIVLAHAGAALPPAEVRRVLEACSNVWMDLSARDPWRFLRFPISGDGGVCCPSGRRWWWRIQTASSSAPTRSGQSIGWMPGIGLIPAGSTSARSSTSTGAGHRSCPRRCNEKSCSITPSSSSGPLVRRSVRQPCQAT